MYVVVQHRIKDPQVAFSRGERLIKNEGAPAGVRGLLTKVRRGRVALQQVVTQN